MIKQTVTYENFNGEQVSEDVYFNLTKAEAIELEVYYEGGLSGALARNKDNAHEILKMIKHILCAAYGEKSTDGKRFIKSKEITDGFMSSDAYSEIFMTMLDAKKAAELINGILPKNKVDTLQDYAKLIKDNT